MLVIDGHLPMRVLIKITLKAVGNNSLQSGASFVESVSMEVSQHIDTMTRYSHQINLVLPFRLTARISSSVSEMLGGLNNGCEFNWAQNHNTFPKQ